MACEGICWLIDFVELPTCLYARNRASGACAVGKKQVMGFTFDLLMLENNSKNIYITKQQTKQQRLLEEGKMEAKIEGE